MIIINPLKIVPKYKIIQPKKVLIVFMVSGKIIRALCIIIQEKRDGRQLAKRF